MYETLWKVTEFTFDYLARLRQVLTLREVEYLPVSLRDSHRLKRQSSFCIIIHENNEENANQRHLVTIACEALLLTMVMSALCKHIHKLTHAQNIHAHTEHSRTHTHTHACTWACARAWIHRRPDVPRLITWSQSIHATTKIHTRKQTHAR